MSPNHHVVKHDKHHSYQNDDTTAAQGIELLTERTRLVKSPPSFYAEIGKLPKRLLCQSNAVFVKALVLLLLIVVGFAFVLMHHTHHGANKATLKPTHMFAKDDFVSRLPGLDEPLKTEWYSGYLDYDLEGRLVHTHYIYVEAQQQQQDEAEQEQRKAVNDKDTPIIFWSNGGPGASSLFGLLTEMGPLTLNAASLENNNGIPKLFYNQYSWNRLGSILMLDAPAPVGYSYCDNGFATKGGLSCGDWNDELAAQNNYKALLAFYQKFPFLEKRPLYLTGQSYAGIYIPMLAKKILENSSKDIPLKGLAVGNPCFGFEVNCIEDPWFYQLFFLAGHGQISLQLYHKVMDTCGGEEELKKINIQRSPECQELLDQVPKQAGGYFDYNLYNDCPYEEQVVESKQKVGRTSNVVTSNGINDYVCGGGLAMDTWVQHPSVKAALHISENTAWFDGDDGVGMNYNQSEPNLSQFYKDISQSDIRVLVYDGDADPSINSMLAQDFLKSLKLNETESWRPWTMDSCRRMGGYVTRYEGSLDYVTIRGSGHFVPMNKPEAAFAFLESWIKDKPYPGYDPDCEHP